MTSADCCFICASWKEFASLDLEKVACEMRTPLLIDGRRFSDAKRIAKGVIYRAIGLNAIDGALSLES